MSRPLATESAFRAIAHPLRRAVLDRVRDVEMTVSELHEAFSRVGNATLSAHLRVLRESGLLKQRRRGSFRLYQTNAAALDDVIRWLKPYARDGRQRPS